MPKKSLLATIANSTLGTVFLIVGGWTIGTKVAEVLKAKESMVPKTWAFPTNLTWLET